MGKSLMDSLSFSLSFNISRCLQGKTNGTPVKSAFFQTPYNIAP